ncbi:50S ribosomal protein L15e [Candidatus Woesearchaeota archaeon]|nr:50S ribosomal protein L15e [Candidatus Woesearchaeota archaeon]
MSMYKYVRDIWKKPSESMGELWKSRLIRWRKEGSTVRIPRPTRIDRARSLGYKAKQGFIVVRQKVLRGGHQKPFIKKGRRPKRQNRRLNLSKNYQQIAEERANRKYPNCEVLNSYWVAEDGMHYWYEVILVDTSHPAIRADKDISWICEKKGRVFRGKTSAGRKGRGLLHKGKGTEKLRPARKP